MLRRFENVPLRILLIEDSRAEAIYIEKTLTQSSPALYKVHKAQSIAAGLALLSEQGFDVVLLDLGLPDNHGFSGLQAILNVAPKLPVVILTGQADPESERSAMENGAQDYLLKDLASVSALSRAMRHAIQRKQIENMKSEFISLISHELRTPLTSIHGSLGLLNGSVAGELPEKAAGLIRVAYRNSERLISLINDVLDIEKVDSGQMHYDPRSEAVSSLVSQAIDSNLHYALKLGVFLNFKAPDSEIHIHVDANRVTQILANFISNAIKYSPAGAQIDLTAYVDDGWVYIKVKDTGSGISTEFKDRIFKKFSQADSALTRQKGGAGLGLYISKQMAEQMGGAVGFDSEPGQGSTFWVKFPRCAEDADEMQASREGNANECAA
jgi:signal transduction histidine kinase